MFSDLKTKGLPSKVSVFRLSLAVRSEEAGDVTVDEMDAEVDDVSSDFLLDLLSDLLTNFFPM